MERHKATNVKLVTEDGKSIWQCSTCLLSDRDPVHIKHRPHGDCKDTYGNGTPGCEGCDHDAQQVTASGCPTGPYRMYCGSAFDNRPSCVCGRPQSSD